MSKVLRSLFLALFFVTPLIFSLINSEQFEIPKMYFVYLITILIVFFHALNYFKKQTSLFVNHPLNFPVLLFLASQILATIFSIDRYTSFFGYYTRINGGLLSFFTFASLFFILPNYLDQKFIKKIIYFFLTSGATIAIYGILQHFGVDKRYWPNNDVTARVFSTLGQPNWLAAYLCILIPLSFFFSPVSRFLFLVSFSTCLIFTKSKSGFIAIAISLAIYAFLKFKLSRKILIIVSCFLLLVTSYWLRPAPVDPNLNITSSADIRKLVWNGAIDVAKKYPIFGTGPETFAFSYYWVRPASHNNTSEWEYLYDKVHNEYLNYLATSGLVGIAAYLLLIISSIIYIYKNQQYEILASYISILITSFAGFNVVVTTLFLFLLPLLSAPITPSTTKTPFRWPILVTCIIFCLIALQNIQRYFFSDVIFAASDKQESLIVKSYQLRPDNPTILSKASVIFAKNQKADYALAFSAKALKISPYDVNLWKERTQMLVYLTYLDTKYYPEAIKALDSTAILAPTDAKTFYLLGKFYDAISDKKNTEKNFLKAIELKSNYDYAYFDLAVFYFNQQKYDLAKKYFELNLKYAPTNPDAPQYLAKIATLSAR